MTTSLETRLKARAHEEGFALVGVAPATEADGFGRLQEWLARGYAGEMAYLHRNAPARRHPESVLAGVKSVVMVGLEYGGGHPGPADPPVGRVARYAQGPDYHRVIWDKLDALSAWLEVESPGCTACGVADTAPILERDFARRAGLGWVGKNTMLIHPRRGSFFFLGTLLTDLELNPDAPFAGSHCGTCTACLDACPTAAFPEPRVLDATKCVSYLTIELRSPIPEELRPKVGDWLFGCDVCQDVCPWNRKPAAGPPGFPHHAELEALDPAELLGLDANAFRVRFKKTSLFRPRRAALLRNAAVVLGNVGDARALPALEKALGDAEGLVREAAAWAIGRIEERAGQRTSSL